MTIPAVAPVVTDGLRDPCNPSPCGSNAVCKQHQGAVSCVCQQGYIGDPYLSCQPECILNSDCPHDKACVNNKCRDLCRGTCGISAECQVMNHSPSCSCLPGYAGNPFVSCQVVQPSKLFFSVSFITVTLERVFIVSFCQSNF